MQNRYKCKNNKYYKHLMTSHRDWPQQARKYYKTYSWLILIATTASRPH